MCVLVLFLNYFYSIFFYILGNKYICYFDSYCDNCIVYLIYNYLNNKIDDYNFI